MRLTKIKLAGFKSFVDPMVFQVPERIVTVVGPNGCGKSNIIDAVRWVMGESAARQLRGDSMEDVIFSGSSVRQPIGQASVELVFDNTSDKLGGPWTQYNEIAIKRLVNRGGQSSYFLNGTRCRRRDITGIFLGTGLGPRSYSIIEQGLITRLIESKPEELRFFLEEAAGISKYKERRRETENRIRHTRENLERLNDVREELGRQLQHLRRQARNAEKFKQFRDEERQLKAQLLALRWRALATEINGLEASLERLRTEQEALLGEQRGLETQLLSSRDLLAERNEALTLVQQHYYEIGAAISRIEQQLQHLLQLEQQRQQELQRIQLQLEQSQNQLLNDQQQQAGLEKDLAKGTLALERMLESERQSTTALAVSEAAMQDWQTQWQRFNEQAAEPQRQTEVERVRIEQLERTQLQAEQRLGKLQLELGRQDIDTLLQQLQSLRSDEQLGAETLAEQQQRLLAVVEQMNRLREQTNELNQELHQLRSQQQSDQGRLASLRTLQEAALGEHSPYLDQWLEQRNFHQTRRVSEQIEVAPGWESAVEAVLQAWLDGRIITPPSAINEVLQELPQGRVNLIVDQGNSNPDDWPEDSLARLVRAPQVLAEWLGDVIAVTDVSEALKRRGKLGPRQSLMTRDGLWLGAAWIRIGRPSDDENGVLTRVRLLRELEKSLVRNETSCAECANRLAQVKSELGQLENEESGLRSEHNRSTREHLRLQGQITTLEQRLEQQRLREQQLQAEQTELAQQLLLDQEDIATARLRLEQALAAMEQFAVKRDTLTECRDHCREVLQQCRKQHDQARHAVQQYHLRLESLRSEEKGVAQAVARGEQQVEQLQDRRHELTGAVAQEDESGLRTQLEDWLQQRLASEQELAQARRLVAELEAEIGQLEQQRGPLDKRLEGVRESLQRIQLQCSEAQVRQQGVDEQLAALDLELEPLLQDLPSEIDEAEWQQRLLAIAKRIERLGPINLAAIEEHAELDERKQYLDTQDADLHAALEILETAISKIDRETRSRFRDTFDKVNDNMRQLYPRLFGGGQGYLELTENDALSAGVRIMARPPGKRPGNIHLLSGGEKALTAIALVFAIFQLNPSPFCMLDEVDAPLDDANVGRFGRLVEELSEQVQFIIVTHNKATMEIAQYLAGVTMHEPGVSRLVAVDVDEAVRLAAVDN